VVIRYQLSDHLGSASVELDENADIISYEEYYPFGSTSYRSGRTETEVKQKRYKYVLKELDNETGLYYYGARYYASWLGRFIAIDPKQHSYQHLTPYNYVANSPLNNIDPDGMDIIPTDEETAKGVQESINVTFERYSKIASHFSYKQTDDGKYIFNSSKWEDIQTDLDSYKDEIQLTEEEYNDLRAMTVGIYNAVNIEKTIEVTFFEEYGMPIAS